MNEDVCVVGLGHVGLPLAAKIASLDRTVLGLDTDSEIISCLRKGNSPFYESGLSDLLRSSKVKSNFRLTESWSDVSVTKVVIITVGTPVSATGNPILTFLEECTRLLGAALKPGQLLIYRSTMPPGTLNKKIMPLLEDVSGLKTGRDFKLAYCPERLVEGVALRELMTIPHIISGVDEVSMKSAVEFFESLGCPCVPVSQPEVAEMAKIMDNVYRDTNIALANEFSIACEELGIDVMESIIAANTSPRTKILIPGCGVGGSCLNKDPYVLLSSAKNSARLRVIKASRQTNESMPELFVSFIEKHLSPDSNKIVCLLGLSFKSGTDDIRSTVTIPIGNALMEKGYKIRVFDPLVSLEVASTLLPGAQIVENLNEAIRNSSALVICADHSEFRNLDLDKVKERAASTCLIVDGRNILDPIKVSSLGLKYLALGRQSL
jgi:dTDP-alpha-D-glucose dehydrogenase